VKVVGVMVGVNVLLYLVEYFYVVIDLFEGVYFDLLVLVILLMMVISCG